MEDNHCTITIESMTSDGYISITNGEDVNNLIINIKNGDGDKSTICITKKEFKDIAKLVNKIL